MTSLAYFSHTKTNSSPLFKTPYVLDSLSSSSFSNTQTQKPNQNKNKKISLYLFKNNWLFMMINPNEWSKGSHFIRCYLKPIASMAETQVIEVPWLHHKLAWPNLQGIKSSPTTSGGLLFICFYFRSILFFYVWLKRLYICLVGYGFENLVFFLRIWKMEVLVLGMDFFFFQK